jgi:hypothetical protein
MKFRRNLEKRGVKYNVLRSVKFFTAYFLKFGIGEPSKYTEDFLVTSVFINSLAYFCLLATVRMSYFDFVSTLFLFYTWVHSSD